MPYYILNWRGSDSGLRRFFAPDAKPGEPENEPARLVTRHLVKELEAILSSYHEFVLERTEIVYLGEDAHIHKPKRGWRDVFIDLTKIFPKLYYKLAWRKYRRKRERL